MKTYKMLAFIPDWDDDPAVGIGVIVIFSLSTCVEDVMLFYLQDEDPPDSHVNELGS